MAYEWVAPVATGAVGIVGVVATYLTGRESRQAATQLAREQRDHDATQQRRAEARAAYNSYLEAASGARQAMVNMTELRKANDRAALMEIRAAATAELSVRLEQVHLVAPPELRELAIAHYNGHLDAFRAITNDTPLTMDHDVADALTAHMKRDLGHTLAKRDRASLKYSPGGAAEDPLRTEGTA